MATATLPEKTRADLQEAKVNPKDYQQASKDMGYLLRRLANDKQKSGNPHDALRSRDLATQQQWSNKVDLIMSLPPKQVALLTVINATFPKIFKMFKSNWLGVLDGTGSTPGQQNHDNNELTSLLNHYWARYKANMEKDAKTIAAIYHWQLQQQNK